MNTEVTKCAEDSTIVIDLGKYSILDHIVILYTDMLSGFFPEKNREDNEVDSFLVHW